MDADALMLDAKVAYFKQLKGLSRDGDDPYRNERDDEFDAREERRRRLHQKFFKPKQEKKATPSLPHQRSLPVKKPEVIGLTPRRITSAPQPESAAVITTTQPAKPKGRLGALLYYGSDVVQETPLPETARREGADTSPLLLQSKRVVSSTSEESPSLNMKKRKKSVELKLRPEGERIFKDLSFFYLPDNDIAPARRLRINKAKEFGATWTRNVATATHVIVDKNLEYKEVEKVLAKFSNRPGQPRVVNEDYPIDCIQFRAVLDPSQKKYLLAGQKAINAEEQIPKLPPNSKEPAQSLQLKTQHRNKKKWDYVPQRGTPSQGEESSHANQVGGTMAVDSQPVILDLDHIVESPKDTIPGGTNDNGQIQERNTKKAGLECRTTSKPDELSKYILMMQEFKDLPLDPDEDDAQSTMDYSDAQSDIDSGSSSESEQTRKRRKSTRRVTRSSHKDIAFEEKFACNRAGEKNAHANNPNTRTIEVLESMLNYYERINDHWRVMAYRKAISTLKRQDIKITTEEEAFQLPSIGRRLAQKIEEIVMTNKLKRLEYAEDEPMDSSLEIFLKVYGVGNKLAEQWIAQGLRTLDDVKQKVKCTPSQLVGVEHYDDLNTKIPRREVTVLGEMVKKAAARIDPRVQLVIGGSYRRGAESSGDIDFIVTKPNTESSTDLRKFLDDLIRRLESDQFLVARLASSRGTGDGSKWHGCCVLPKIKGFNEQNYKPVWRRIDFLLVPETEVGAALIYFTGNDIFNRSMRLLARKKGMRLNQRGLYRDVLRGRDGNKVTDGELVEGRDEKRIFEILGVKWREPHERWC